MSPARWGALVLDEIVHDGARETLATGLQALVAAYVEADAGQVNENDHALSSAMATTPHGKSPRPRAVKVRAPQVSDKQADEVTWRPQAVLLRAILPA